MQIPGASGSRVCANFQLKKKIVLLHTAASQGFPPFTPN